MVLRKGLASELVLMAFLMPNSGYNLAQMLQNTKGVPNTSKVYPALKSLVKAGYLIRDKDKYRHNPAKLTSDLIQFLKDYDILLEENEAKMLQNMLTSGYFFNMISAEIYEEFKTRQIRSHDIYILDFLRNKIGMLSSIFLHLKKLDPESNDEVRGSFEKINEDLSALVDKTNEKMYSKLTGTTSFKKNKMKAYDLVTNTMKSFILFGVIFGKIPIKTLEKFAHLWNEHHGFVVGIHFGQFRSKGGIQKFTNDMMKSFEK